MRSSEFSGVRGSAAMQVTDVSGTRRTVVPSPENRKVDGSTPSLATTACQVDQLMIPLSRQRWDQRKAPDPEPITFDHHDGTLA